MRGLSARGVIFARLRAESQEHEMLHEAFVAWMSVVKAAGDDFMKAMSESQSRCGLSAETLS